MKNIIKKLFLTIMVLLALYKVTSFSQTVSESAASDQKSGEISMEKDFILYKSIPQVFSDVTVIRFDLKKPGNVQLEVFSSEGDKVETLAEGEMEPGIYNVYFKRNEGLENGEYFYVLDVNGQKQMESMKITSLVLNKR